MIKFLQAACRLTIFQIVLIGSMTLVKYIVIRYHIVSVIGMPLFWICVALGIVFMVSVGLTGLLENRGDSVEEWKNKTVKSTREKLILGFTTWGFAIPVITAYVLFIYIITPTLLLMALALYAGIVIRNCIQYFSDKQSRQAHH